MRFLLLTILFSSFLFADEMQRIDSIVKDISKLRQDYARCQDSLKTTQPVVVDMVEYQKNDYELKRYKRLLLDEKEKNAILIDEINSLNISIIESKNKKVQIPLKEKELESASEVEVVEVVKLVEVCSNIPVIDPNPFPKLMPKETKVKKKIKTNKTIKQEKKKTSSAKTYRLNKESSIYDSPNSKEIQSWEKDTSFTSNKQTDNWIKITGYFVDKKFRGAKKSMWVEQTNATLR